MLTLLKRLTVVLTVCFGVCVWVFMFIRVAYQKTDFKSRDAILYRFSPDHAPESVLLGQYAAVGGEPRWLTPLTEMTTAARGLYLEQRAPGSSMGRLGVVTLDGTPPRYLTPPGEVVTDWSLWR